MGELQDISQEAEEPLRQVGCQVQRVQGTLEQISTAFAAIQATL